MVAGGVRVMEKVSDELDDSAIEVDSVALAENDRGGVGVPGGVTDEEAVGDNEMLFEGV